MSRTMNRYLLFIPLLGALFLSSCEDRDKNGRLYDQPTSGTIKVSVDETLRPLGEAEIQSFEGLYTRAHLKAEYVPEAEAFANLLKDSSRLIIVARDLNDKEKQYIKDKHLMFSSVKIASDAIALVTNKSNPDSNVTEAQLADVMRGKTTAWKDLGAGKDDIKVVFDNANSSTLSYLKERYKLPDQMPANFFAVKSNTEVINYVQSHPDALGIIGVNWISSTMDSQQVAFMDKIRVLAVSHPDSIKADETFYQPYQAYIALKYYPLVRTVYAISNEGYTGLATGFSAYLAGDKGQTVVRLYGLLPATMHIRLIQTKKEF